MPDDTDEGMLPESTIGPERTPGFSFNGPDIEKLVKTATAEPDTKGLNDLLDRVKKIPERQEAEVGPIRDKFLGRLETDQAQLDEKYKAISELDVKPWTQKPPEADPWKAFGSPGSVFAMVASAFTRTPMTNALNAGAAAMNASRAGDLAAYKSAFDAWKENTDLAIKRHEIQYKDYQAAADLMRTDVQAGDAALRAVNAKYGDEYAEAQREAGLLGDITKLYDSRQKGAMEMLKAIPAIEGFAVRQEGYLGDPGRLSEDPNARNETYRKWFDPQYWHSKVGAAGKPELIALNAFIADYQAANDGANPPATAIASFLTTMKAPGAAQKPEVIAMKKYIEENPDATPEQLRDFALSLKDKGPAEQARQRAQQEYRNRLADIAENKNLSAEQRAERIATERERHNKAMEGIGQLRAENIGAGSITAAQRETYDKWKEEFKKKEEREPTADEQQVKLQQITKGGMTGNKVQELQTLVNQYENSMDKMDSALSVLDRKLGVPGAPGYATRLGERVGNIFGSDETSRVQFMRTIELLRLEAPRLLTASQGRPLSSEAKRVNDIVAGLEIGDTTANTKRALEEIQTLYAKMMRDTQSQIDGKWVSPLSPDAPSPAAAAKPPAGGTGSWKSAPVMSP